LFYLILIGFIGFPCASITMYVSLEMLCAVA